MTAVHCSDQPIDALSKIIQWKNLKSLLFLEHFTLKLLMVNGHLVARAGIDGILGNTSIDTSGLQTTTVDVNHIHKARYSFQLSVVSIYTCLKEAHEAINSALLLVSLVEERCSSSCMFKYWMLIMKFQIDYLVFIRSMREDNFNFFVKILISLTKWLFILDHYNYARFIHRMPSTRSKTWKKKFCDSDFW